MPATPAPATSPGPLTAAGVYIAIMGLGMALMHHGFGYRYGAPDMFRVIGPVEVVLTLWTLWALRRLGGAAEAGFGPLRPRALPWLLVLGLPVIVVLGSLAGHLARSAGALDGERWTRLAGAAATTGLVGFSEEAMFRGVLLHGAWRTRGLFRAMLLSAAGFALLHAVNVLGGSPPGAVAVQLAVTFLFGLTFAPLAVRLGSLWPLVVLHAAWDFGLFAHEILGVAPPAAAALQPLLLALAAPALWWTLRGDRAATRAEGLRGSRTP